MRKLILAMLLALTAMLPSWAERSPNVYGVGFYNLENLFDTCHDQGKDDYQFLPDGSYKWDGLKYAHKLRHMAQALSDMGTGTLPGVGCAVIGVAEVENGRVLRDLCDQPALKERGYQFCHVEGPDQRGVDCALLYQPSLFTVDDVRLYPYVPAKGQEKGFRTRGFLAVSGRMAGDHVVVIVCHLPSRFNGSYYREVGAAQARALKDRVLAADADCKVIVMGDMNDDPTNRSMTDALSAKADIGEVGAGDMFNPWYDLLTKQGTGTLQYHGSWNLFDQITLSPTLLNPNGRKAPRTLKYLKCEVQRMPYLFQTEGKHKGYIKRTTAGGVWLDGYSDHLPTVVYLVKRRRKRTATAARCGLPAYTEAEEQYIAESETEDREGGGA